MTPWSVMARAGMPWAAACFNHTADAVAAVKQAIFSMGVEMDELI